MEESPETVAAWVRRTPISMDVLLDPPGVATRAWAVTATPSTFLIDRGGRLVARAVGTRPWTEPEGRAVIDALLAR